MHNMHNNSAGFTLSRALFRKKCGPFNWDGTPYLIFLEKNWRPFFAHHSRFHSRVAHFSGLQKLAVPFVGPLFVGPMFGRCSYNGNTVLEYGG